MKTEATGWEAGRRAKWVEERGDASQRVWGLSGPCGKTCTPTATGQHTLGPQQATTSHLLEPLR